MNQGEGLKTCSTCRKELPLSEFSATKAYKDGLKYECKSCNSVYQKKRYQSLPVEKKAVAWARGNAWKQDNKEKSRAYQTAYSAARRAKLRAEAGIPPVMKKRRESDGWYRCPHCRNYLPPESFNARNKEKGWIQAYCRLCVASRRKAKRHAGGGTQ